MNVKNTIVDLLRWATGAHIYRVLPRGLDLHHDMRNGLPHHRVGLVFDVGANVGQSAKVFLTSFPGAQVCCFEPVAKTFRDLETTFAGNPRVSCFQIALGSSEQLATMAVPDMADMSRLVTDLHSVPLDAAAMEEVHVSTVDAFCAARAVDRIHYLKVDAEGADLEVLRGASRMLAEQRIDLVEVEAGMHRDNEHHVAWEALKSLLESHRYFLFGVYEQVTEWPTGRPHLRRANLAFVSAALSESNRVR